MTNGSAASVAVNAAQAVLDALNIRVDDNELKLDLKSQSDVDAGNASFQIL